MSKRRQSFTATPEKREKLHKAEQAYRAGDTNVQGLARRFELPYHVTRDYLIVRGVHKPQIFAKEPMPEKKDTPPDVLGSISALQKKAIKNALDAAFDEVAGTYAEGKSDQELGRQLNVPWAAVAKIREDFFGPLRADPDVENLRLELEALRHRIATFTTADLDEWLAEFDAKMAELDQWRKEIAEWRRVLGAERQQVNEKIVDLKSYADALAEKLAKVERRFG